MRAVNLIPAEERRAVRGQGAGPSLSTRLLLGGLGAAVLAVTVLVLVSNQINSKRDELGKLESKQQNAVAATEALRPYGEFVSLQQARYGTVTGIASSRFNWERVVRQLSRVVPPKVWIMQFRGTVTKDTSSGGSGGGGGGGNLRGSVPGPAVELKGCSSTQSDSARLMTRLRNIDGVESVVMTKSGAANDQQTGGGAAAPAPSSTTAADSASCPKLEFEILVAFRASGALASAAGSTPEAVAQAAATGTTGATGATGTTGATGATTAGATR